MVPWTEDTTEFTNALDWCQRHAVFYSDWCFPEGVSPDDLAQETIIKLYWSEKIAQKRTFGEVKSYASQVMLNQAKDYARRTASATAEPVDISEIPNLEQLLSEGPGLSVEEDFINNVSHYYLALAINETFEELVAHKRYSKEKTTFLRMAISLRRPGDKYQDLARLAGFVNSNPAQEVKRFIKQMNRGLQDRGVKVEFGFDDIVQDIEITMQADDGSDVFQMVSDAFRASTRAMTDAKKAFLSMAFFLDGTGRTLKELATAVQYESAPSRLEEDVAEFVAQYAAELTRRGIVLDINNTEASVCGENEAKLINLFA